MRVTRMHWTTGGIAGVLALSLAACSGSGSPASVGAGGSSDTKVASSPTKYDGAPVTLEYWGDNPALKGVADLFNKQGSKITVKFTEQAGNVEMNTGLRNAFAAGGGPCVFDGITENLTSLASDGIAMDITKLEQPYKSAYSPQAWNAVKTGNQMFGIPASSIPAFMIYNARVFKAAGLQYPKTWDDFVAAGKALSKKGAKIYNLAGEDYTTYVYLAWQAGAQWWELNGGGWKVNVDSPETAKAAKILQSLIDDNSVTKISYAEYAAMMKSYNDGKIASRQLSTWQTKGQQKNLTTGLGEWEPAANPTFTGEPAANVSFTRVFAVNSKCKTPEAAVYFANWMATNKDAISLIADPEKGAGWFPAVTDSSSYISISQPAKLLGAHISQWEPIVSNAVKTQKGDWAYGPDSQAAFKVLADEWGKAVAGKIKVADIAPFMQKWIVNDLKQSGIKVTN